MHAVPPEDAPGEAAAVRVVPSGRLWLVTVDGVGRVGRFDTKSAALRAARSRARRGVPRILLQRADGSLEEHHVGRRVVADGAAPADA